MRKFHRVMKEEKGWLVSISPPNGHNSEGKDQTLCFHCNLLVLKKPIEYEGRSPGVDENSMTRW